MKNTKKVKKEVMLNHYHLTGEVLALEKKAESREPISEDSLLLIEKIKEEMAELQKAMAEMNRPVDKDYLESFDIDYAKKLAWVETFMVEQK